MLGRALKLGLRIGIVALFVVIVAAVAIWQWPTLLIHERSLLPIVRYFVQPATVTGEVEKIEITSVGFFTKRIVLTVSSPCYADLPANSICAERLETQGSFHIHRLLRSQEAWLEIGKLEVKAGTVAWEIAASSEPPKPSKKESGNLFPVLPEMPTSFRLRAAAIDLKAIRIRFPGGEAEGKASIQGDPPFDITASATARIHKRGRVKASATSTLDSGKLKFRVTTDLNLDRKALRATIDGELSPKAVTARINTAARGWLEAVPSLQLKDCSLSIEKRSRTQTHLTTHCPVTFQGGFCKAGLCQELFRKTEGTLTSDLELTEAGKKGPQVRGAITYAIPKSIPLANEGKILVSAEVGGHLGDLPNHLEVRPRGSVEVQHFGKIVRLFRNRPWAVPAPLNAFDGTLALRFESKENVLKDNGEIPVEIQTNLTAPTQALKVAGNGKLTYRRGGKPESLKGHFDLDLALLDIRLALPPLSASGPPNAFPDNRIVPSFETKSQDSGESAFTYDIRVQTHSRPILLASNLAQKPVPIYTTLRTTSEKGTTGSVRVASFPVEIFRRKATIEYLTLGLRPDSRYNEINGKIVVRQTDYTISILLLGLAERPEVRMESEPPLPESEILSVLLFGRRPEKLSAEETYSVGNARAAIQENAISLASMYVFASTPIESVGYNPLTKSVTAKIRLADGTSMMVGSDFKDINQLGLRQRLGSNWSITTYMSDPFSVIDRTVTALLEWSVGY